MEEMQKAFDEYKELVIRAHKIEDEMLDIPKSAAEKSGLSLDLLAAADNRRGMFGDKLSGKYKELKEVESKLGEARKRFMRLFLR